VRNLLSLILGSFLIVSLSYADPVPSSGSPIPMGTGFTEVSKEDGTSPCSGYLLKFTDAPTDNADGSCSVAGGAGTLGGADTQVQFNDGGALAGEATFIYNKALNSLSIDRIVIGPGVADYLMPTARGAANTYLRDNGSGAITFSALSGIGPANFTASTDFGDVNTDAGGALRYGGDSIDPAAINWGAYTYLGEEGISLVEAYAAVGTFESGDTFICYEAGVGARECDYDDLPAAGSMTSFIVEDGDGTEISISDAEEWKFVEGTGIDIDWTDTTPGSDADPFDLTFTVDLTVGELDTTALTASEILITDASKDIISAAVATYPSLAELAYVKGLSSAVQTQINAKGAIAGQVWTGTHDFGGAVLEIPNGATVTDPASVGQVAIDSTSDQFLYYGTAQRVLTYKYEESITVENIAAADDSTPFGTKSYARTVTNVGCRCMGTCTTPADFSFSDSAANAFTLSATPTCATTGAATYVTVNSGGALIAGEGMLFNVTNSVAPETDWYEIMWVEVVTAD